MMKALKNNRLVTSPAYGKILLQYNRLLQDNGKVNNKKFFEQVVAPELPNYNLQSWYQFLKRFKTAAGIEAVSIAGSRSEVPAMSTSQIVEATSKTLMSNAVATSTFIQHALNIGAARAKMIAENPELMTAKEAMDFAIKAMKAQDSRIHAIGKVREDNREEEKLARAFSDDAYAE